MADVLDTYVPWRVEGAPPPQNPLLDDAATGLHPWLAALRSGDGILASPSVACGAVGALAALFGLLSPVVLVPFLTLPRELALTGLHLADLLASFGAFYAWRRGRGDGDTAAALGATIWASAPARAVYRTWPFCGLFALYPLLLLFVDRLVDRPPRPSRIALGAALLTAGVVLGGHPSFGLLGVALAAAYGVARLLARRRLPEGRTLAAGAAGACAALLALSPCLALGERFLSDGGWRPLRAGLSSAPPVPWRVLLLLVDPSFYGDPVRGDWRGLGWAGPDNVVELQLYAGLATLLLAPLALLGRRRREAAFWAAAGLSTLLVLIVGGPLAALARLVPGLSIVFLSRARVVFTFALAALAVQGLRVLGKRYAVPLLLFACIDLSVADLRFDPFPPRPDAAPAPTPALRRLRELAPGDGHRFVGFGNAVPPNVAFELGLEDLRSHLLSTADYRRLLTALDPAVFGRRGTYLTFEAATFHPEPALLDLLGVSALIAPPGTPPPGGDFSLAHRGPDADVWARPWTPPVRLSGGRVTSFAADGRRWRVTVDATAAGTLVLGRSRIRPVDRVLVDGVRREPAASDGLLAVVVAPGRHEIVVDDALPSPLLFLHGLGVAGLLALALLSAPATLLRSSRR